MPFLDKLGGLARNIGDKASDAIETTKLNSKISTEKNAITACMKQIGEYYYNKYLEDGAKEPGVAELFAEVDSHNQTIAETQAEISRIQTDNAKQAGAASTPAPPVAPAAEGEIICPSCSKANPAGTKFCGSCGAALPPPAPPKRFCPECGEAIPVGGKFCGGCGHRFE